MYASCRRMQMVSTHGGMRRILKNKGSVVEYIRQAVESGVYRSNEELEQIWKERRQGGDLRSMMRRFRQDIVRGSHIHDYPAEYFILKQHPPIPDPPRTPKKLLRRMQHLQNPTTRLVQRYLQRQEPVTETSAPQTTQDYYRRLLGVPAPPPSTSMGQKSAAVQRAYAAAVAHYQLQRTEGLSDEDALKQVEEMLKQQKEQEQHVSRERSHDIRHMAQQGKIVEQLAAPNTDETSKSQEESQVSSTRFSAQVVEGMMLWSERLQAVPYRQWTIGASTALDHWIARRILELSEETWQTLLEGEDPSLLATGRDIVAVREALFPETILEIWEHNPEEDEVPMEIETKLESKVDTKEKTIEELLASLGGIRGMQETKSEAAPWISVEEEDKDAKVFRLTDQLQDWRRQNVTTPYEGWSSEDKARFTSWMREYVKTLVSDAERGEVDYDMTREALLGQAPSSQEESEAFWSQLEKEETAMALLDAMRQQGPPPGVSILHKAFWKMPYDEQLDRLLNLGAVRELVDEYTKESERLQFLQRYGDSLLSGVEMEHLVPDTDGPIKGSDLGAAGKRLGVGPEDRFRLEVRPYLSSGRLSDLEKTRALFEAWNLHKAGRARYEEKLFRTGRLGLQYNDETKKV